MILLQKIATVDPNDAGALDELDAKVFCYVHNLNFEKRLDDFVYFDDGDVSQIIKYSRSLDAQQSIVPDGWILTVCYFRETGWNASLSKYVNEGNIYFSCQSPTEPLARLYCIISAIDWERNNG